MWDRFASSSVVVLDGALATELEGAGIDLDHPLWSARCLMERPQAIVAVHRAYVAAGADVITTATYQATIEGFVKAGVSASQAEGWMQRAADLAREAAAEADREVIVAGSVGSYGAFLADGSEYRGDYGLGVDDLVAFHRPRLELLADTVDLLACETVPCLVEAEALARALRGLECSAWVTFSCRDERHVAHGESLADCVEALSGVAELGAVGVNCTAPRFVEGLIRSIRERTDLPIVVYPNSGEGYGDDKGWCGEGTPPEAFADLAERWVAAGARIVGGCCRTGPAHVAALRQRFARA